MVVRHKKKARAVAPKPPTVHPAFDALIKRISAAFASHAHLQPSPELYLGVARILINEAMQMAVSRAR